MRETLIRKLGWGTIAALHVSIFCCPLWAQSPKVAAQYKLDASSGTAAADSSGNGLDGAVLGDAVWTTGLPDTQALKLSGRPGNFVDIPKPVVDTSQSFTVMATVKLGRDVGWQTLVSIDGDQVSGFFLQLRDDTGEFAFCTLSRDDPGGDTTYAGSKVEPQAGVWYQLAGVYDAGQQTLTLYVNGSPEQTTHCPNPWKATGHTVIGRAKYAGRPVDFADATIENVRFYSGAVSSADVQAIARGDLPEALRQAPPAPGAVATIDIDAAHLGPSVSPMQHGLMTEEINHAYDGGLYGELISNRVFKDSETDALGWSLAQDGGSGSMSLDTSQPLSDALPVSLKLQVDSASGKQRVGAANSGFWGIPVKPRTTYRVSFFARSTAVVSTPISVDIESPDGSVVVASSQVSGLTAQWHNFTTTLKTGNITPTANARFVVSASRPGVYWLNLVSVFGPTYKNRPNGDRIDLMQELLGLKPAFLRFPGGNYLEGNTIDTRFDWKKTIGPVTQRPGHRGPWGYRSSDGFGMLEFLEWCEDLHMQPLVAVYAGYSLNQYRGGQGNPQRVAPGPALAPYVQDALDEIEYITGSVQTKWGAERAKDGHPAPFALEYVEVGNEDGFDRSRSYDGRFAQFYDAIKAAYPNLKIIATTPVQSRTPDVLDEHYYLSPRRFERDVHHYDDYPRNGPKVFVGEWASQEGDPTPDMNSALGDAAWMTGMERNADVVVLESYAPLLVRVDPGARQWGTNLIGYDALTCYGSPSYYVQQMFHQYQGDTVLRSTLTGTTHMAVSVTRDSKTGKVFVKAVNWWDSPQAAHITISGARLVGSTGVATVLASASPQDTNTIDNPTKVAPVTSKLTGVGATFSYTFAPYSVTVLEVGAK